MILLSLQSFVAVFEALANLKRIEIFEYLLKNLFVSKTELATDLNLNRAALNHHLKYLVSSGLIIEQEMMIDGRKHIFVLPIQNISIKNLLEVRKDIQCLQNILISFQDQNLTLNNWQIIRSSLQENPLISEELNTVLEVRFFQNFQDHGELTICWICGERKASLLCQRCQRPTCETCNHTVEQQNKSINYCRNCIESLFG